MVEQDDWTNFVKIVNVPLFMNNDDMDALRLKLKQIFGDILNIKTFKQSIIVIFERRSAASNCVLGQTLGTIFLWTRQLRWQSMKQLAQTALQLMAHWLMAHRSKTHRPVAPWVPLTIISTSSALMLTKEDMGVMGTEEATKMAETTRPPTCWASQAPSPCGSPTWLRPSTLLLPCSGIWKPNNKTFQKTYQDFRPVE